MRAVVLSQQLGYQMIANWCSIRHAPCQVPYTRTHFFPYFAAFVCTVPQGTEKALYGRGNHLSASRTQQCAYMVNRACWSPLGTPQCSIGSWCPNRGTPVQKLFPERAPCGGAVGMTRGVMISSAAGGACGGGEGARAKQQCARKAGHTKLTQMARANHKDQNRPPWPRLSRENVYVMARSDNGAQLNGHIY